MRLRKLMATFLFCGLVALTGCGESATDVAPPTDADASDASDSSGTKASDEKVTLTIMDMYTSEASDSTGKISRVLIDEFIADHPNITIEEESIAHDAYEIKIKTVAQSNSLPDVFQIKGAMVQPFAKLGVISPIDADLDSNPEWRDSFVEGAFYDFTYKDEKYGYPYELANGSVIFYNKDIFDQCGITEFPADWDSFKAAIGTFKEKGFIPIALGNKGKWVAQCCIFSTMADRYTGSDWFTSIQEGGGAKFTDPEFIDALKAYEELSKLGAFNEDANSIDNDQQKSLYMSGDAAMFFEGSWAISEIDDKAPEDVLNATEFGLMPSFPGGKGDLNAVAGGTGWAYAYNNNLTPEKKAAAIELINYLTSKNFGDQLYGASGQPAVNATIDESKVTPLFKRYIDSVQDATWSAIYDVHLPISVNGEVETGLQEIMLGSSTPEQVAEKIQAEYERVAE
ncbi:extracellular solute-binding protein [Lachnospiraceae bacterium ZAX-1]